MNKSKQIVDKYGDGIDDPELVLDYDPLFKNVLGSGVDRRDFLKMGSLAAMSSLIPSAATFAQEKKWDPVVRIGYIPITDAAALLVAHELGFFKKEGIESVSPNPDPWLVTPGGGLCLTSIQPDPHAYPDPDLDALQQQVSVEDNCLGSHQWFRDHRSQGQWNQLAEGFWG